LALYYAKERGRNRVEVATLDLVLQRNGAALKVPGVVASEGPAANSAAA
jgi:hypothetical protein